MALIVDGREVPCRVAVKDWREHGLTFRPGDGARKRDVKKTKLDLMVWHWTGGEGGFRQLFSVLQNRELGVEFYIQQDGVIYQFADPILVDTFDAGYVNPRSIGVEIANAGMKWNMKNAFPRDVYEDSINGKKQMLRFYPAQLEAAVALGDAISTAIPTIPRKVPRGMFGFGGLVKRTLSPRELRNFAGHIGHYHITTAKTDPGTDLLEYFMRAGYG